MTLPSFFGNLLTAYGPPLALFLLYTSRDAQRVILFMTAAFFWLLSILLVSLLWYFIKPMQSGHPAFTILVAVGLQELGRWTLWRLVKGAEGGLEAVSKRPGGVLNRAGNAWVLGLGIGLMSGLTTYATSLAESAGPAIVPCDSCPGADVFFIGGESLAPCRILPE